MTKFQLFGVLSQFTYVALVGNVHIATVNVVAAAGMNFAVSWDAHAGIVKLQRSADAAWYTLEGGNVVRVDLASQDGAFSTTVYLDEMYLPRLIRKHPESALLQLQH